MYVGFLVKGHDMKIKDILLSPMYLYQANQLKKHALILPEAEGERSGDTILSSSENLPKFSIMVVGDSAAAGVGVDRQEQALLGQLLHQLQHNPQIAKNFSKIIWRLYATTGHTSFDILKRLYTLSSTKHSVDIMVLSIGVNDATKGISSQCWQDNLADIVAIAQRKFGVKHIIFSSVPPMAYMPSIPKPLNQFIGDKATHLDQILQQFCQQLSNHQPASIYYLHNDITHAKQTLGATDSQLFAKDGFHPSELSYDYWARQINQLISSHILDVLV